MLTLDSPLSPIATPPTQAHLDFPFRVFTTCFGSDSGIKWFCRGKCPSTDGRTGPGARRWRRCCGFSSSPHCCRMWQNAKWNSLPPSVQNWLTERTCDRHDGMSFAGRASLGDSCDVYRAASMTVGGGGSALFRQELGLSSDSKILLIYDISTPVFSPTPLTSSTNAQRGDDDIRQKCLFVYLPLSPQRIDFPPVPSRIFDNQFLLLRVAVLLND